MKAHPFLLLLLLALAACAPAPTPTSTEPADSAGSTRDVDPANESEPTGEAGPGLPAEAERYIEIARQMLAAQPGITPRDIMLDGISGPDQGAYLIRLEAGGAVYEYRGQNGQVILLTDPSSPSPDDPVSSDGGSADDGAQPPDSALHPLVVEEVGAQPGESDDFALQSASVEGDALVLQVGYSGGCAPHEFTLHWAPLWLESLPVQTSLWLLHEANDDACEAFITETLRFDLSPLRAQWHESYGPGEGTIVLRLADAGPLHYEFAE